MVTRQGVELLIEFEVFGSFVPHMADVSEKTLPWFFLFLFLQM